MFQMAYFYLWTDPPSYGTVKGNFVDSELAANVLSNPHLCIQNFNKIFFTLSSHMKYVVVLFY